MIDSRASMTRLVSLLEERLRYMEFEGRILHPIIDRFACEGPMAFSASTEYEHRVVGRRIGDLAASARDTSVDARTFARRVDRLRGLLAGSLQVRGSGTPPGARSGTAGALANVPRAAFDGSEASVAFPESLGAIPGARRRSLWGGTEGPGRIRRGRP